MPVPIRLFGPVAWTEWVTAGEDRPGGAGRNSAGGPGHPGDDQAFPYTPNFGIKASLRMLPVSFLVHPDGLW